MAVARLAAAPAACLLLRRARRAARVRLGGPRGAGALSRAALAGPRLQRSRREALWLHIVANTATTPAPFTPVETQPNARSLLLGRDLPISTGAAPCSVVRSIS